MFFLKEPTLEDLKVAVMDALSPGEIADWGYCTLVQPHDPFAWRICTGSSEVLVKLNDRSTASPAFTNPRPSEVVSQLIVETLANTATAMPRKSTELIFFIVEILENQSCLLVPQMAVNESVTFVNELLMVEMRSKHLIILKP